MFPKVSRTEEVEEKGGHHAEYRGSDRHALMVVRTIPSAKRTHLNGRHPSLRWGSLVDILRACRTATREKHGCEKHTGRRPTDPETG